MRTFVPKRDKATTIVRGLRDITYWGYCTVQKWQDTALLGQGPAGFLPTHVNSPYLNRQQLHVPHHSRLSGAKCLLVSTKEGIHFFSYSDRLELTLSPRFLFLLFL
jgi:hypothetical protein